MASIPSSDYSNPSIPTAKTIVVAAVSNTKRLIRKVTFTNNTGAESVIDIYFNPTGASEVQFIISKKISNQETWSCIDIEGHVLEANGTLAVKANLANMGLVISTIYVT